MVLAQANIDIISAEAFFQLPAATSQYCVPEGVLWVLPVFNH
jgi:hypothetical protein